MSVFSRRTLIKRIVVSSMVVAGLGTACTGGAPGAGGAQPGLAAEGAPSFPPDSSPAKIQARGKLIVATTLDRPLVRFQDPVTKELSGFEIDVIKEIATTIFGDADRARLDLRDVPFPSRVPMVQEGVVDIAVGGMDVTKELMQAVDISDVYFATGVTALVPRDSPIQSSADLAGKRLIVVKGSATEQFVRQAIPSAVVLLFDSTGLGFEALQGGRADAQMAAEDALASMTAKSKNYRVLTEKLNYSPISALVRKGRSDLLTVVNRSIRDMKASGRWQASWKRSYGTVVAGDPPAPPPAEPDLSKLP